MSPSPLPAPYLLSASSLLVPDFRDLVACNHMQPYKTPGAEKMSYLCSVKGRKELVGLSRTKKTIVLTL